MESKKYDDAQRKKNVIMGKAIVKLSLYTNSGMLTVHILKARHLFSRYTHQCQPVVQLSLEPDPTGSTRCFTAVSRDAPHPTYNEKFSFETLAGDMKRRLYLSVWNNNGPAKIPEFLGSMSFGLQHVLTRDQDEVVSGWYYLLKEEVGRRKHLPALLRSAVYDTLGAVTPGSTPMAEHRPMVDRVDSRIDPQVSQRSLTPSVARRLETPGMKSSRRHSRDLGTTQDSHLITPPHNSKQVCFNADDNKTHNTNNGRSCHNPMLQNSHHNVHDPTRQCNQSLVPPSGVLTGNSSLVHSHLSHALPVISEHSQSVNSHHNASCEYVQFDPVLLVPISSPVSANRNKPLLNGNFEENLNKTGISINSSQHVVKDNNQSHCLDTSFVNHRHSSNEDKSLVTNPSLAKHEDTATTPPLLVQCKDEPGTTSHLLKTSPEAEHDSGICESPSPKTGDCQCAITYSCTCCTTQHSCSCHLPNQSSETTRDNCRNRHSLKEVNQNSPRLTYNSVHRSSGDSRKSCICNCKRMSDNGGFHNKEYHDVTNGGYYGNVVNSEYMAMNRVCHPSLHPQYTRRETDQYSHMADLNGGQSDLTFGNPTGAPCEYHGVYGNHELANQIAQDSNSFRKYTKQLLRHSMRESADTKTKLYFL